MVSLRFPGSRYFAVAALLSVGVALGAQTSAIQQKLESDYPLSKAAADNSDIVTPGAVLVLQKDGLLMSATTTGKAAQNTYKEGRISQGIWKVTRMPGFGSLMSHSGTSVSVTTRSFVSGEKFWVTGIAVHENDVVLNLLSDPFSDVRYYATLKIPFVKGSTTPEQVDALVGEVIKVQPDDSGGAGGAGGSGGSGGSADSGAAAPAATPAAPMAAIAPPPPPPDAPAAAPKTIALKQTKAEVIANFGQPTRVVKLGAKEIDYYPDMKVTFVNNKVTDVQ